MTGPWIPYCGAAPSPADWLGRWNGDPVLLTALGVGVLLYLGHRIRGGQGRDLSALTAFALLAVVFVSPLCALSSALFSARAIHHALLITIIAPLLIRAAPSVRWAILPLGPATGLHGLALWIWHVPAAYGWALSNDFAFWLMQASLLGSAALFWGTVRQATALTAAAALLATLVQTGLLGALLTFAAQPLYAPHLTTTAVWGLTPLGDQQLAGLIMWAPMAGVYLLAALVLVGRSLSPSPAAISAT